VNASAAVRATSKPQGARTTSSGSSRRTTSQVVGNEGSPARPRTSTPPAAATISGSQWRERRLEPLGDEDLPSHEPFDACAHGRDLGLHRRVECAAALSCAEATG
jgi:hypothetical protein